MCGTDEFNTNFRRKQVYFRGSYQNPLVQTGLGFVPFEKKELEGACMVLDLLPSSSPMIVLLLFTCYDMPLKVFIKQNLKQTSRKYFLLVLTRKEGPHQLYHGSNLRLYIMARNPYQGNHLKGKANLFSTETGSPK